tara:strand:- start:63 stop:653 length:591 start_codon:yes stop_codon:yes gene_type:complete
MKELPKYPGYYITEEGDVYRLPVKGERMPINENGLVYLKPGRRGHPKYPEKQYDCVNISIRDEDGKWVKQIKVSNHQLVAETFVPNPHKHTEILHIDENPRNNYYTNLKWGTHKENLQVKCLPEGTIRNHFGNSSRYIKKNGEWVLIPSNKPPWNKGMKLGEPDGTIRKRANGYYHIKEEGKWKHIKQKDYFKYGV